MPSRGLVPEPFSADRGRVRQNGRLAGNRPRGSRVKWYLEVLRKYTVFDGRSHRTEFWMAFLVSTIISIVLAILDFALGTDVSGVGVLGFLYGLAVLLPSLAVGARRLHDTDRSGWWQLLGLIPLIGIIILIVWWAEEGDERPNEHGANPWDGPQPV
jgi:uncharacterized membrane protein YhaH (DUF805 family)